MCERRGRGHVTWLNLDLDLLRQFATGELDPVPESLAVRGFAEKFPGNMLAGVQDKDVLCLGAGGGQQSAVFGLLGARVTVVDLAHGQLEGDRKAGAHYGYEVATIHADMRDLSRLQDESFDIVYATGLCYVPDIRRVYSEIGRVLRSGGMVRMDAHDPGLQFVAWDGEGYRITKPYCETIDRREDGALEFRHYMDDVFGGLPEVGLSLRLVLDPCRHRNPAPHAVPGSWAHQEAYVGIGERVMLATKDLRPL